MLQFFLRLPTEKVSADNRISLFAPLVLHAWTHQEVRAMMHHLKERGRCCNIAEPVLTMHTSPAGMNSFIKEYVLMRNISIPKLLYAFGICLVSQLLHWLITRLHAVSSCYRPLISARSDIVWRTTHETPKNLTIFPESSPVARVSCIRLSRPLSDLTGSHRRLHRREKLPNYNTIADAASLIRESQRIVILTGAGISWVDPTFLSRNSKINTLAPRRILWDSRLSVTEWDIRISQRGRGIRTWRSSTNVRSRGRDFEQSLMIHFPWFEGSI